MGSSVEGKPERQNRDNVGIFIGAHVPIARVTEEAFLAKRHSYAELVVQLSPEMQAKLCGLRA